MAPSQIRRLVFTFAAPLPVTLALFACLGGSEKADTGQLPSAASGETGKGTGLGSGTEPKTATGCDLATSGLSFATEACTACMQQSCCAQTVACVVTDPGCAELQQCLIGCDAKAAAADGGKGDGGGDGGGGGGGGGGGLGDGGLTGCRNDCLLKHPAAIAGQKAYNDCVTGPCGSACK